MSAKADNRSRKDPDFNPGSKPYLLNPILQKHEIIINLAMLVLLVVPAVVFFIKAFPTRRTNPERWQRGLWFILGFLLFPSAYLVALVVAPVMFLIALLTGFFRSPKAKKLFYFALGATAGLTLCVIWIGLLNTFALPQR